MDKMDKMDNHNGHNSNNSNNLYNNLDPFTLQLNNTWVVYQYSKNAFKKLSNTQINVVDEPKIKPYKQLYKITNVGELLGFIKIMGFIPDPRTPLKNLDKNDLVIMKEGIEPIWEDERNANGGTYSFKIEHKKGYELWKLLMLYMLGETLTHNMADINGLSVSFIKATNNIPISSGNQMSSVTSLKTPINGNLNFTYLKIWNSNPNNDMDNLAMIFPSNIIELTRDCTKMYLRHNSKRDFNQPIIDKLKAKVIRKNDARYDDDGFSKVKRKNRK